MDDYKPTTYQATGASTWTEVEFSNEDSCKVILDKKSNELTIELPIHEEGSVATITIEREIFVKALQDAGIIPA